MSGNTAESEAGCTELTCPHHGEANRAEYVPPQPYVRCIAGQFVCTHPYCQSAARFAPLAATQGADS